MLGAWGAPYRQGRNRRQGGGEGRGEVGVRRKRLNKDNCEESSVKSSPCPFRSIKAGFLEVGTTCEARFGPEWFSPQAP